MRFKTSGIARGHLRGGVGSGSGLNLDSTSLGSHRFESWILPIGQTGHALSTDCPVAFRSRPNPGVGEFSGQGFLLMLGNLFFK